jgi:hypothetical protein
MRKKILPFEHFWALFGQRRHKNDQKSLKQAVWDHFEIILVTFCDFCLFAPILVFFFYLKENFLNG